MNKDLEILIKYNRRDVLVCDQNGTTVTELKCKRNHFFSNYYSGTTQIDNDKYSITCDSERITLSQNDLNIGDVRIYAKDSFDRQASIKVNGEKFNLKRKDLKQIFEVVDSNEQTVFTIRGKLYKDKQKHLLGLVYFGDKLFHSVTLDKEVVGEKIKLQLLVTCGYCIRLFLEIDMGDYHGKIYR